MNLIFFYFQKSDKKHDVVWSSWHKRAAAENLQELRTKSSTWGNFYSWVEWCFLLLHYVVKNSVFLLKLLEFLCQPKLIKSCPRMHCLRMCYVRGDSPSDFLEKISVFKYLKISGFPFFVIAVLFCFIRKNSCIENI